MIDWNGSGESRARKQGYDLSEVPNLMTSLVHVQVQRVIEWLKILLKIIQSIAICNFTTPYTQSVFTRFTGIIFLLFFTCTHF